jgi:hypothetical protein
MGRWTRRAVSCDTISTLPGGKRLVLWHTKESDLSSGSTYGVASEAPSGTDSCKERPSVASICPREHKLWRRSNPQDSILSQPPSHVARSDVQKRMSVPAPDCPAHCLRVGVDLARSNMDDTRQRALTRGWSLLQHSVSCLHANGEGPWVGLTHHLILACAVYLQLKPHDASFFPTEQRTPSIPLARTAG